MRAKFIKTEIERRQTSWINETIQTTDDLAIFAANLPEVEYVNYGNYVGYYDTGADNPYLVLKEGGDILTYRNILITLVPDLKNEAIRVTDYYNGHTIIVYDDMRPDRYGCMIDGFDYVFPSNYTLTDVISSSRKMCDKQDKEQII